MCDNSWLVTNVNSQLFSSSDIHMYAYEELGDVWSYVALIWPLAIPAACTLLLITIWILVTIRKVRVHLYVSRIFIIISLLLFCVCIVFAYDVAAHIIYNKCRLDNVLYVLISLFEEPELESCGLVGVASFRSYMTAITQVVITHAYTPALIAVHILSILVVCSLWFCNVKTRCIGAACLVLLWFWGSSLFLSASVLFQVQGIVDGVFANQIAQPWFCTPGTAQPCYAAKQCLLNPDTSFLPYLLGYASVSDMISDDTLTGALFTNLTDAQADIFAEMLMDPVASSVVESLSEDEVVSSESFIDTLDDFILPNIDDLSTRPAATEEWIDATRPSLVEEDELTRDKIGDLFEETRPLKLENVTFSELFPYLEDGVFEARRLQESCSSFRALSLLLDTLSCELILPAVGFLFGFAGALFTLSLTTLLLSLVSMCALIPIGENSISVKLDELRSSK
jgi:hypothetical protein